MSLNVLTVMQNDSLVRKLLPDYNYNRGLVGDEFLKDNSLDAGFEQNDTTAEAIGDFFDALIRMIQNVPTVVWVIIGIFILSFIFYLFFRNRFFNVYRVKKVEDGEEDNIYEIDYDQEMAAAINNNDYAAIVRLNYLKTLRKLDERGTIQWRINKTPSQFDTEVHHPDFTAMTQCFLRVRYGKFPASKQMCEQMEAWSTSVLKGGAQ